MSKTRRRKKPAPKTGSSTSAKRVTRTKNNHAKSSNIQNRVSKVISKMRADGVSLKKASRVVGTSPRTVIKRAPSALRKTQSGRYAANPSDRLVRTLMIPTPQGPQEITVRGLRTASQLGRYWVAVHKYYETGDVSGLQRFRGQSITAVGGKKYPLLTELDVLDRLGSAGVLSFESLYAKGDV